MKSDRLLSSAEHGFPHIDTLKAIGIVLVVLGHAPGMSETLNRLIFAVHIPLFFYASGFLLKDGKLRQNFATQLVGVTRSLLIPYLLFFLLSYGYWLLTRHQGNAAARYAGLPWWDPVLGLLRGNGDTLYVNATLWFFPCLIVVILAYGALRRVLSAHGAIIASGLAALLFIQLRTPDWPRLLWSADCAIVGLFFYALGQAIRLHTLQASPWASLRSGWVGLVLLAAYAALTLTNGRVDLNNLLFGEQPLLFLLTALLGIAALSQLAGKLPRSPLVIALATNTLYIFPLHWLLYRVFNGVGAVVFHLPRGFAEASWLAGLFYAVLAIALCLVFAWGLRRTLAWVGRPLGPAALPRTPPVQ